jgi:hypothetical protein
MSSNIPSDFEDNTGGLEAQTKWSSTQKANEQVK